MNSAASYILTVTAAAILAAMMKELAGQGTMGALVKFLAGLFMALTILSPLVKLELPDPERWMADFRYEGESAAAAGASMANEAERELIKSRVEAYIWDKAAAYGAEPEVEVELDDAGVPVSVTLRGSISPAAKARLTQMIRLDLGIGEEAQQWIG